MDLLIATHLHQKLEYYLAHHGGLFVSQVLEEFEAVKLKLSGIVPLLRCMKVNLNDQNVRARRQALKDLEDEVDKIIIFILRSTMLVFGHQFPCTLRRVDLKKQMMEVHRLAEKIQKIMTDISPATDACETEAEEQSSISLGSRNYGIRPSAYDVTRQRIIRPIHADVANRIEELLLNYKDERFKVIGVIGRKGIGKSRLVMYLYNDKNVRNYFNCYAWISKPSSVEPESFLREILRQFYFGSPPYTLETMGRQTLLLAIHKCLTGKRFLLILDDVSDMEIWESVVFPAFPIFFTTSFLHGAILFTSSFPHRRIFDTSVLIDYVEFHPGALWSLSQEERWALFCRLVFPHTQPPGTCPPELEEIARRVTQKSGGLTLVIRLLAGVLRGQSSLELWKKRLRRLEELEQQYSTSDDTVKAVSLSYDALALPLKSCFLYFSIFPKGDEIPIKRVIRLWVAEGLVKETPERTATEASMAYIQELIDRALIQWARLDDKGDVVLCTFDDQVRRVTLDIIGSNERYSASMPNLPLFSIEGKDIEGIISDKNNAAGLRSCIISGMGKVPSSIIHGFLSRFQLLRVLDLDLEGSEIKTLPNSLGILVHLIYLGLKGSGVKNVPASAMRNLILLRYLGLRRTGIRELPAASLSKLTDLHTLDIRDTQVMRLPRCVSRLIHLRHIYLCCSFRREVVEMPLGKQTRQRPLQLQTLSGVKATTQLIEEIGRWTQLQKLSIGGVAEADSEKFCASINKMNHLRSLSIKDNVDESLSMTSLTPSRINLDTLRIGGLVKPFGHVIQCFPSLCRLFLWDNLLDDDPLPILQHLSNLMVLSLTNTFQGNETRCGLGGFPNLRKLSIFSLSNLERWQINGGMQKLEFLSIGRCRNLKEPLQDLEHLPCLQLVRIVAMDEDFTQKMERIGKEFKDRFMVRCAPLFNVEIRDTEQEQQPGTKHEEVSEAAGSEGFLSTSSNVELHDASARSSEESYPPAPAP